MVRSYLHQSHHAVPESNDSRHRTENRSHNRPRPRSQSLHGKSSRQHSSWHTPSERRGSNNANSRSHVHVDSRGNGSRSANIRRGDFRSTVNSNRTAGKRQKWRRNKPKKRRGGRGGPPPLSGGNIAPVVGSNRQPIASMRMRMDDYITPRTGRLLPLTKSTGNDIERVVARARREASTRTKDTFWTKKLLDAESSHPTSRWAHTGFKEMYREELGYSQMEKERSSRRSPNRSGVAREDFLSKKGSAKSPSKQSMSDARSRTATGKLKKDSRFKTVKLARRKFTKSRSRSRSRSVRSRRRIKPLLPKGTEGPYSTNKKISQKGQSGQRGHSHSLSRSLSSVSSRFESHSDSRSYSSYTSSRSSSESSSSFSSSSSGSLRSYKGKRRSYSRSWSRSGSGSRSRSKSRSPSIARIPPPKIKTASMSKAVHSVHLDKEKSKNPLTKTVNNIGEPKTLYTNPSAAASTATTAKNKARVQRPLTDIPHIHRHTVASPAPAIVPEPVAVFHEKESLPEKNISSAYIDQGDKAQYKSDSRRGAENSCSTFKISHSLINASEQREANAGDLVGVPRSEGEQSNTESSSDDDDDIPMKMTLSERFGKLAQLSSQRQEYEGVRMRIVREGGQDKKVYIEGGSRSPSPLGRPNNVAHQRWLREHKAEYDEYEERYGEFREWDPHRDLPRELPPNWDDVNVRYRYYKESGYFGERSITMEDYLKWEEWWYRYRDWLEKYGGAQEENRKYRGPYGGFANVPSATMTRDRWIRREDHRDKDDRKRLRY